MSQLPAVTADRSISSARFAPSARVAASTLLVAAVTVSGFALARPAAAAPAATTVVSTVVFDAMNRSVLNGLGSAPTGGRYSVATSAARTRVVPGRASITNLKPGARARASLDRVAATDTAVRLVFSPRQLAKKGGGTYVAAELRRRADGSAYRGRVRIGKAGTLSLSFTRVIGRREIALGGERRLSFRIKPGRSLALQVQAKGTTAVALSATAWLTGTRQPASQLARTDASGRRLAQPGSVGWFVYQSRQSALARLDLTRIVAWAMRRVGPAAPVAPVAPGAPAPVTSPATPPAAPAPPAATEPTTGPTTPTPDPTPNPDPNPEPTGNAGSTAVGSASYPVPSDALFVSETGDDRAAGTVGAPLRTVQYAVNRARSGQTIVVRGGSYHEYVFVGDKTSVTVQNYPGEAVWFDGSVPVTNWARRGSVWVADGWNANFDHSASFTRGSNAGGFVNANYPLAPYPDQLFVDGTQLAQVAAGVTPGAGQFAVDTVAKTLTIGTDPAGRSVRSSDLQQAFVVAGTKVNLRGFGVRRYATSLWQLGSIYFGGKLGANNTLENLVVEDNASQGVSISSKNTTLSHLTVRRNGYSGIHSNKGDGLVVQYSSMSDNNTQHWNTWPAGGDLKVTRVNGFTARGNETSTDSLLGIWTDISVTNFSIVGNRVTGATYYGILVELSQVGVVANNVVENSQRGATALDSGSVKFFNNQFKNNSLWDLGLNQDGRWRTTGNGDMNCPSVPGNVCTWRTESVVIANNVFGRGKNQIYVLDNQSGIPADAMKVTIDGNSFSTVPAGANMVAWGKSDNRSFSFFQTPAALAAALNSAWQNQQQATTYSSKPGDAPSTVAVPLPADVAAAVSQVAGLRWLGLFS